ncbi:hypothetical protein HII28_02455 [Planctomonas sp. JC2975]|uniref:hypothetical protein n=1 Tax=Planctomonas sp. JC2975 TaxID=2729626 RepID=UPI001472B6F0|nr:hypothetical protein [Planctomonas sp. JC2975]NNC10748.1 hypothetical protein [Planctomonas sp. JC2975]
MDERRRLLERVYSRAGASEEPEPHVDPVTGEAVSMTRSQWALAEYDRVRGSETARASGVRARDDTIDPPEDWNDDEVDDELPPAGPRPEWRSGPMANRLRKAAPVLAVVGGLALGSVLTLGVEEAVTSAPPQNIADGTPGPSFAPVGAPAVGSGDGDEADTLSTVARYFADTPTALPLSVETTRGFDATSFRLVAGGVSTRESSAIYAAHRLDGDYCLVAVTGAGRAAETCATLDGITRNGLWLAKEASQASNGRRLTVTVTWATDGTITWVAVPAVG